MPIIDIAEFPVVARSGRVSEYAPQMNELVELLKMDNFGAGHAVSYEIHKDKVNPLVTALRKEAKGLGRKVQTIFKDSGGTGEELGNGVLYVKDNGAFDSESESATKIKTANANKAK